VGSPTPNENSPPGALIAYLPAENLFRLVTSIMSRLDGS
jgi:hypothetical protein